MQNYTNSDLMPMSVSDVPWLYERQSEVPPTDKGKWMLFYDKPQLNSAWLLARQLFREQKMDGVNFMSCSTSHVNERRVLSPQGVIIFYCSHSKQEPRIMTIGRNLLQLLNYTQQKAIFYKTEAQTSHGTRETGSQVNYTYKLPNHLWHT